MKKIITCIDGLNYIESICKLSAFAAKKINSGVNLLHVVPPHDEFSDSDQNQDLSGAIGIDFENTLLEKLTKIDEERTRLHQQKGQLMLDHAQESLSENGVNDIEISHRRGSFCQTLSEFSQNCEIVIVAKFGENSKDKLNLGANIEKTVRLTKKPILIAPQKFREIKSFLIAYDGSKSAKKALEFACQSDLFKNLNCHILTFYKDGEQEKSQEILQEAKSKLQNSGFLVKENLVTGDAIEDEISSYIAKNEIDLLAMGAFGHSKIHNFILGSVTESILARIEIASILFG